MTETLMRMFGTAMAAAFVLAGASASAQTFSFDFEDGTDQGFGSPFGSDAGQENPIVNIGGSLRMEVLRDGGFQETDYGSADAGWLAAFNAAVAAPSLYEISYDWYVDTSLGDYGGFLQLGTYINGGSPAFSYTQDFPGTAKDVELDGTQLGSGSVFSGTVTETLTDKYGAIDPGFLGSDFGRLGFIINGDGADATVYFDNIVVRPVPEPASLGLLALGGALLARRRR